MVLADAKAKAKAYAEVDSSFADQPGPGGKFAYEKLEYLTSCLKETLRMKARHSATSLLRRCHAIAASLLRHYRVAAPSRPRRVARHCRALPFHPSHCATSTARIR